MGLGESRTWEPAYRVAIVHSFYSSVQSSGENRVVEQQADALRRAGCSVGLFAQYTDRRSQSRIYPLKAAVTVATGLGPNPRRELLDFQPDVVHVHNLFPNFGRSWVTKWDGPLVATVHNYRPLCAAATFYRDGHVCTDCLDARSSRSAVRHGCYRGSRAATVPLALSTRFGDDPLLRSVDRLIVLNNTSRDLYERAGVERERIALLPNFGVAASPAGTGGDRWLFVGRLTPEKGVLELVREWPNDQPLDVIGTGPLLNEVARACGPTVRLLGKRTPAEVSAALRDARGLVFPSRWFEGFPMVYLEALAAGTPVVAWEPSSVASLVRADGTGIVVDGPLAETLREAGAEFPALRKHCRATFNARYTETRWLKDLRAVYNTITT